MRGLIRYMCLGALVVLAGTALEALGQGGGGGPICTNVSCGAGGPAQCTSNNTCYACNCVPNPADPNGPFYCEASYICWL